MKIIKIAAAVLFTLLLLYVARKNAMNQPRLYTHIENGFSFEYTSVPKGFEDSIVTIPIKITGPLSDSVKPVFRKAKFIQDETTDIRRYDVAPMFLTDTANSIWSTKLTAGMRGKKTYYYFEIKDNSGGTRAKFTMEDEKPFVFKFIGIVPSIVLVTHIALIFATFFLVTLAAVYAVPLITGNTTDTIPIAKFTLWAVILCFLGGYPIGFAMNWFAFNGLWEGVPFGTDATDNKTQLWFVYLLFLLFSLIGSLKGKPKLDLVSSKTVGWLAVGSFVNTLFIFLIPHSIQFTPNFTITVCWSYIGFFVLLYLILLIKKLTSKSHGK
ncbi:MAG: hypothetical protein DWP97_11775 [Calditrichaeota bacterium]|nr:MAG: hypothetical protein DWP97_11775 [Calditrichota bacterium]